MESGAVVFEDIHAVAARLVARRLGRAQKRAADREASRLSETIRARQADVRAQIQAGRRRLSRFPVGNGN